MKYRYHWSFKLLALLLAVLSGAVLLEESGIVKLSRYRVRAVPAAGALVRPEDAEEKQMDLLG